MISHLDDIDGQVRAFDSRIKHAQNEGTLHSICEEIALTTLTVDQRGELEEIFARRLFEIQKPASDHPATP